MQPACWRAEAINIPNILSVFSVLPCTQSQAFCEDFAKEREDRISAITKLNRLEEELKSVQMKLEATESELERHKTILEDTETIAARNTKQLTSELEATKAEISVKVAQVKQYQKQVEMYKLQVHIHVCSVTCSSTHAMSMCMGTWTAYYDYNV